MHFLLAAAPLTFGSVELWGCQTLTAPAPVAMAVVLMAAVSTMRARGLQAPIGPRSSWARAAPVGASRHFCAGLVARRALALAGPVRAPRAAWPPPPREKPHSGPPAPGGGVLPRSLWAFARPSAWAPRLGGRAPATESRAPLQPQARHASPAGDAGPAVLMACRRAATLPLGRCHFRRAAGLEEANKKSLGTPGRWGEDARAGERPAAHCGGRRWRLLEPSATCERRAGRASSSPCICGGFPFCSKRLATPQALIARNPP